MVTRRAVRRLLPFVCAVILLRIYVIRLQDDSEEDEDAGIHKWHQFTPTRDASENEYPKILPSLTREINVDSQDDEILLGREIEATSDQSKTKIGSELPGINVSSNRRDYPSLWTRLTDDLYTYSGFWDTRTQVDGPVARVLGVWRYKKELMQPGNGFKRSPWVNENALNCSCLLWYSGRSSPSRGVLKAFVYEEGIKEFTGTFLLCYPASANNNASGVASANDTNDNPKESVPYAVSFVPSGNKSTSFNVVHLKREEETTQSNDKSSAVCVRPLFGPYDDLAGIAQFISYYSTVLNVNHFYFYDLAISEEIREYLSRITSPGTDIEILPWNVPTTDWERLWDLGSLTALNDCIYRSSGRHGYVAVVDIDEFIVPKLRATSLEEVYKRVIAHKKGQRGDAALIRNVFFCHEFVTPRKSTDLPIFKYIHRESRVWPSKQRSKMIVVPETVMSLGHHMIHHFTEDTYKNQGAPHTVALLHHYRACEGLNLGIHGSGERVLDQQVSMDGSMRKFKASLMKSTSLQTYKQFLERNV